MLQDKRYKKELLEAELFNPKIISISIKPDERSKLEAYS